MGFARISPVGGKIYKFSWFKIGEFFRFNGSIWVKYSDRCAINISSNNDTQEFSLDANCENIEVELKVL